MCVCVCVIGCVGMPVCVCACDEGLEADLLAVEAERALIAAQRGKEAVVLHHLLKERSVWCACVCVVCVCVCVWPRLPPKAGDLSL